MALALLVGCTFESEARVPDATEAEALVAQAYAARDDGAALCELASSRGNCEVKLHEAGIAPSATPDVVCTQRYEGHEKSTPGLLVRTVTDDASGATITFDTIAIDTPEGAKLMNVVYWVPSTVSDGNTSDDSIDFTC